MGEQSPAWKNPAPQPGEDRRPRPHCSGPAGCRGCGAAVQGVGSTPHGRLPPAPPSQHSLLRSRAQPAGPGRQEAAGLSKPGRPGDERRGASSRGRASLPTPALRAGAADSAWPGQAPTHSWRAHPSVRPCRSRRCGRSVRELRPSVRQPRGSGATSRGGAVAGLAPRSTGGSRPAGAALGRAAAAEQAGKRSSPARRPRRGRTPLLSPRRLGAPSPPSPAGVLSRNLRPHQGTAPQARRTTAVGKSRAVS